VVVSADGDFGTVDAVVTTNGTAEVYNITVDEAHTYFVGDGAWLVHNSCPNYSLSNLDDDMRVNIERNRQSLDAIQPGEDAGWTGAFDLKSNKFILIPSGQLTPSGQNDTILRVPNSQVPLDVVARTGGHQFARANLLEELYPNLNQTQQLPHMQDIAGFHLSYPEDDVLKIGWKSGGINSYNFGNVMLPNEYRSTIEDTVKSVLPNINLEQFGN